MMPLEFAGPGLSSAEQLAQRRPAFMRWPTTGIAIYGVFSEQIRGLGCLAFTPRNGQGGHDFLKVAGRNFPSRLRLWRMETRSAVIVGRQTAAAIVLQPAIARIIAIVTDPMCARGRSGVVAHYTHPLICLR